MKTKDNIVYVLMSDHPDKKRIYLTNEKIKTTRVTSSKLSYARIFQTERRASKHRFVLGLVSWEIYPVLLKTLFKARLKGI